MTASGISGHRFSRLCGWLRSYREAGGRSSHSEASAFRRDWRCCPTNPLRPVTNRRFFKQSPLGHKLRPFPTGCMEMSDRPGELLGRKTGEVRCCSCLVANLCQLVGNFNRSHRDRSVLVSVALFILAGRFTNPRRMCLECPSSRLARVRSGCFQTPRNGPLKQERRRARRRWTTTGKCRVDPWLCRHRVGLPGWRSHRGMP